ncbi:MAG: PilZ domain-containing protein [Candidatus Solibacter sp.]
MYYGIVELDRRNRRAANRYHLELPFEYRLFGRDQSVREGRGRTLNMSSRGLLLSPDERITKGLPIELSIQMPHPAQGGTGARLVVLGHVLRSGPDGAAIRIVRHGFMRMFPPPLASDEFLRTL